MKRYRNNPKSGNKSANAITGLFSNNICHSIYPYYDTKENH